MSVLTKDNIKNSRYEIFLKYSKILTISCMNLFLLWEDLAPAPVKPPVGLVSRPRLSPFVQRRPGAALALHQGQLYAKYVGR